MLGFNKVAANFQSKLIRSNSLQRFYGEVWTVSASSSLYLSIDKLLQRWSRFWPKESYESNPSSHPSCCEVPFRWKVTTFSKSKEGKTCANSNKVQNRNIYTWLLMAWTNIDKTEQNVDTCGTTICRINNLCRHSVRSLRYNSMKNPLSRMDIWNMPCTHF